nr:transmembrane protein 107 isoform X1 [Equus caballus]
MPWAWRCPNPSAAVTASLVSNSYAEGHSGQRSGGLGPGRTGRGHPGRKGCSGLGQGGFPFARPTGADSAVRGGATPHTPRCTRLGCALGAGRRSAPGRDHSQGTRDQQPPEDRLRLPNLLLSRDFRRSGREARLRGCQGNWAVPARAGRRRLSSFCVLASETSGVAIPELPAPETTASAPGSASAAGGHGPDLRTRAFSLPDAPGASGGRHHLILVPDWWPRSLSPWASLQWSWPVSSQEFPCSTAPRASSSQAIGAHCSASVALSFFIFERWECTTYWYIFVFCSALPAVTEMALFISVFGLKKKPF